MYPIWSFRILAKIRRPKHPLEILKRVGWEHRQPILWGDLSQRRGNTRYLRNIHERDSQPGGAKY